jgi:hypothetical protein
MYDEKDGGKTSSTVGNGQIVTAKSIGKIKAIACNKDGDELFPMVINEVHYMDSPFNLLSGTRMLSLGYNLSASKDTFVFTKGKVRMVCDLIIKTSKGKLYGIYLKRVAVGTSETTNVSVTRSIKTAHCMLGHKNEDVTRKMAKYLGWNITRGMLKVCEACAKAKAKRKDIKSKPEDGPNTKAMAVNGRIYLDISSLKQTDIESLPEDAIPRQKNWRMIVDEYTGKKTSHFFPTKNGMIEPTCELMHKWNVEKKPVMIMRMDNAGENIKLVKRLNSVDWKMYPKLEYTPRDTPQYNHLVEVGFPVIANQGRSMMNEANIPTNKRYRIWYKAYGTACDIDGLVPIKIDGVIKTRDEHFSGKLPEFSKHLRTWGEAGVVKTKKSMDPKMNNRGTTCMFVGYAKDHPGDTYEMLNWNTMGVLTTRDVIWLDKMYFDKQGKEIQTNIGLELKNIKNREENVSTEDGVDDDEGWIAVEGARAQINNSNVNVNPAVPETRSSQNNDESAGNTNNPFNILSEDEDEDYEPSEVETDEELNYDSGVEERIQTKSGRAVFSRKLYEAKGISIDDMPMGVFDTTLYYEIMTIGAGIGGGFIHTSELIPMKYDEAMRTDKAGWEKAVHEEYLRMIEHGVFKPIKKKDVPHGTKVLSSTWAMKQKASGTKRARINARGFEQRSGVHYEETGVSSPVVNEASIFMILILITMTPSWKTDINDVKGAFLNGLFSHGEKLYMEVPEGFEKYYDDDVVLELLKTIYGLKQAAFEYWRALLKAIRAIRMIRNKTDPCVYFKWTENGLCLWASWVDDILSCGNGKDVDQGRKELRKHFTLDEQGEMKEYVGCKIELNREEGWMKLTQPVLLQSFDDEFDLSGVRVTGTPAPPGSVLTDTDEVKVDADEHYTYRKGVGKMIHMTKYSRPEIANAVRELSRFGSKPTPIHSKAMKRVMKYCVNTNDRGLMLKPTRQWDGRDKTFKFRIKGISDSDYAKEPVTRRSVGGWSAFLEDAPYTRKSKMQATVKLSVTEAEADAGVNCVNDMIFGKDFLESMDLVVELPMVLYMDNKGAVDLFNNWSVSSNSRHYAVRLNYVRELKEQGIIAIKWMNGMENPADLFTKNLDLATFEKHAKVFLGEFKSMKDKAQVQNEEE